jgi:hypothetical protein
MHALIKLFLVVCVLMPTVAYSESDPGVNVTPLSPRQVLLNQVVPSSLARSNQSVLLTGKRARYLLLDRAASVDAAIRAFARGDGMPYPNDSVPYIHAVDLIRQHKAIYLLGAIRSSLPTGILAIRTLQVSHAIIWQIDANGKPVQVTETGDDLPDAANNRTVPIVRFRFQNDQPMPFVARMELPVAVFPLP